MGAIWIKRAELVSTTGEIIGYKSGIALRKEKLSEYVPTNYENIWYGDDKQIIRIRSEDFEDLITSILYGIGNISTKSSAPFGIKLFHKYKHDSQKNKIFESLFKNFISFIEEKISDRNLDITPFIKKAEKLYGIEGVNMAFEIIESLQQTQHKNSWVDYRRVEWQDIVEFKELFESESLETFYGSFIDQRYIDYLDHNFDDINNMNWRKFEGLTCEFFDKRGYEVEIGKGRDDGGIDARVWPKEANLSDPPAILIQCKRQKRKVGKMVVKSLWADMKEENADSGLIVTTSSLLPGAENVCTARGYNIEQADRETLREWIKSMRTPYKGIFLGE
ncbi:restriction endonuclease [Orenia marismortui]|uniref:Restriction system protein n=1 Tax=Orenia marismortui TaxID=46469 RepID=A0A4R8GJ60_9FIRM|nr:restriction endonuclease [Orenia marismortui]TDX44398.1 restriction system protein [Orenia marismortui]